MAFKAIALNQESGNGELPWLNEYIQLQPKAIGKTFQVNVVAFSQKGVMLTTNNFKAFLYRSNPYYDFLMEALEVWTTDKLPVMALVALVDTNQKCKFQLGIEDQLESSWDKKGNGLYKRKLGIQGFKPMDTGLNPLLAVSSTSRLLPEEGKGGRGRRTRGKTAKAAQSLVDAFPGSEMIEDIPDEFDGFNGHPSLESED